MDNLELEQALIDYYKLDPNNEDHRRVWSWSKSIRLHVQIEDADFWVEIYGPDASETNKDRIKAGAYGVGSNTVDCLIAETSVEAIDTKLKDFIARRKKRIAKKIIEIKNILDYVKYKLHERGIKYTNHGGYIIIASSSPIKWYISFEQMKTGEECLTLMVNSPVHGTTYRLDGVLADPSNKLMDQVLDIIDYFKGWDKLVQKYDWKSS